MRPLTLIVLWMLGAASISVAQARPEFEKLPDEYVIAVIHEITHNAPNDSSGDGRTYTENQGIRLNGF